MSRSQVLKMYEDLNEWIQIGIGDDILNATMRPEYQDYVKQQQDKGVNSEDIPQQVLWSLREQLKDMPLEPEQRGEEQPKQEPEAKQKITITFKNIKIEISE